MAADTQNNVKKIAIYSIGQARMIKHALSGITNYLVLFSAPLYIALEQA